MMESLRGDHTEEERRAWIKKFLDKPCIGCQAVQEAFRKLFFTKTS